LQILKILRFHENLIKKYGYLKKMSVDIKRKNGLILIEQFLTILMKATNIIKIKISFKKISIKRAI